MRLMRIGKATLIAGALLLGACSAGTTGGGNTGGPDGGPGDNGGETKLAGRIVYAAHVEDLGNLSQVFSMNPDGTDVKMLTTTDNPVLPVGVNDQPVMSPDGKTIVFASGREVVARGAVNPTLRQLYVMKADGSEQHKLTQNEQKHCSEHNPRFSDDGAWILYTATCDDTVDVEYWGKEHVHRIKPDGTGDEKLTAMDGNQVHAVLSRDGKTLVYDLIAGDGSTELYSFGLETKATKQLTHAFDAHRVVTGAAMPTSDGKLLFVTKADGTQGSAEEPKLESIALDGSHATTVRALPVLSTPDYYAGVSVDSDFSLSPDGTHLVYVSFLDAAAAPATYTITVSRVDGSEAKAIAPANDAYLRPMWR